MRPRGWPTSGAGHPVEKRDANLDCAHRDHQHYRRDHPSIEPLFALAYPRQGVLGGRQLGHFNPLTMRHLRRLGLESELESVASTGRLSTGCVEIRNLFATTLEIPPEQHVRVQAAFRKHVDNVVSKTVNLEQDATPSDVAATYQLPYKLGCKGVTVFRYGSKADAVLQLGFGESPEDRENFAKCDPDACRL